MRTGRISRSRTGNPRRASCHAASLPANPAPITFMVRLSTRVPRCYPTLKADVEFADGHSTIN
jgi:hypothetical protein